MREFSVTWKNPDARLGPDLKTGNRDHLLHTVPVVAARRLAAQELLSTFADDLARVALEPATGGVFRISCDGVQLWERTADGGFPEAKVLKQRVRDQIDPSRDLGHNERRD